VSNPVLAYVADVAERAVKAAAEAALVALGGQSVNVVHHGWQLLLAAALGGAMTSTLISLASAPWGDKTSASLVNKTPAASSPVAVSVTAPDTAALLAPANAIFPA
jgi:hypothetical protein